MKKEADLNKKQAKLLKSLRHIKLPGDERSTVQEIIHELMFCFGDEYNSARYRVDIIEVLDVFHTDLKFLSNIHPAAVPAKNGAALLSETLKKLSKTV